MKTLRILSILTFIVLLASCRSAKQNVGTDLLADGQWSSVYSSVNLEVNKPMQMGFSARLTMQRGEYIHMSMRVFGIEAAAMYIDRDSAFFVDKYHRYSFAEPLNAVLGSRYGHLTLTDIQKIILGQEKLPATDTESVTSSGFVETPAGEIASRLIIKAYTPNNEFGAEMTWKPQNATWNDPSRRVNFKFPEGYTRITVDNLQSVLKSLN